MFKKVLKNFILSMMLLSLAASAQVRIAENAGDIPDSVSVAGNPDMYPIEYYDENTGSFKGILPDILTRISDSTGVDFTYVYNEETSQRELLEASQVEMISAYDTRTEDGDIVGKTVVFTYLDGDREIPMGFAFTKNADEELIHIVSEAVSRIKTDEDSSYFVQNTSVIVKWSAAIIGSLIAVSVLLAIVVIVSSVRMRRIKKQSRISRMTDPETGAGNRIYFEHRFHNDISDFSRRLYYISYIIIDSNCLQTYHGEVSLKTALNHTAKLLSAEAKRYEIAARISESGFAFAFQSADANAAEAKVEEIVKSLNSYVGSTGNNMKPVFYAAVCNLEDNDRNCQLLLFNLRKNCNEIAESDNPVVFCDSHMMNRVQIDKEIAENIERGLKNGEFKLYLQFIIENKTKRIVSAEALSRWEHPENGLIPPGKYIDAMNVTGVITEFDYYMFELVCKQLEKWQKTSLADLSLSCNMTRITISEEDFADKVAEIAKKYSFDRKKLIIEITEDAIERNIENAQHNVAKCKKMGFRIALDDFGSGYTSLINLCEYPIDLVKIDRSILLRTDKKGGKELFHGIIALTHSLNLKMVCEGVETEVQNTLASQSGCDYIQGWFYSRPIPEQAGEEFVTQYNMNI